MITRRVVGRALRDLHRGKLNEARNSSEPQLGPDHTRSEVRQRTTVLHERQRQRSVAQDGTRDRPPEAAVTRPLSRRLVVIRVAAPASPADTGSRRGRVSKGTPALVNDGTVPRPAPEENADLRPADVGSPHTQHASSDGSRPERVQQPQLVAAHDGRVAAGCAASSSPSRLRRARRSACGSGSGSCDQHVGQLAEVRSRRRNGSRSRPSPLTSCHRSESSSSRHIAPSRRPAHGRLPHAPRRASPPRESALGVPGVLRAAVRILPRSGVNKHDHAGPPRPGAGCLQHDRRRADLAHAVTPSRTDASQK